MSKGTSQAEVMSNGEPIALAIIELRLSKGMNQSVSRSVENFKTL